MYFILRSNVLGTPQTVANNVDSGKNPWDMTNIDNTLLSTDDPLNMKHSKSPEQFLGNHANLVNLDNLVTKPTQESK